MFAYLEGKLTYKEPYIVVIDVNGVGYEIRVSVNTYSQLQENQVYRLFTWLNIKEDAHTLFGFLSTDEKKLFLQIISISGVGPGTALMLFSSLSTNDLRDAIASENVKRLQTVKGIGAKTAERIILELKDKVKKESGLANSTNILITSPKHSAKNEALEALQALGIIRTQAEKMLEAVVKKYGESLTVEDLVKLSLKTN